MLDSREVPSLINAVCLVLKKKKIGCIPVLGTKSSVMHFLWTGSKIGLAKCFLLVLVLLHVLNAQELTFWQKGGGKSHRLVNYWLKWVKSKVSHRRIFIIR